MSRDSNGDRRLLLIPFAPGIGDTVMMEPLLRAVVSKMPDWQVTMVAREHAADLLVPGRYHLATSSYFVAETPAPLRPFHRLIPQRVIAWAAEPAMNLDVGPFDQVANLFWAWESRIPFDRWWMPRWPPMRGICHTVDVLADFLQEELGIGISEEERVPRLRVLPEAAGWVAEYLGTNNLGARPLVSLVVSGSNALKGWTAAGWAELSRQLIRLGQQPLLIAPRDNDHAWQVYRLCDDKPLWPEVGLRQMAGLLALSEVVVGVDTGPLHMAAALGAPWVGLFGPTNPDVIGPYDRSRGQALVARFPKPPSCKDCWLSFKNREADCLTLPTTSCTTLIPVDEVLDAVLSVRATARTAAQRRGPVPTPTRSAVAS